MVFGSQSKDPSVTTLCQSTQNKISTTVQPTWSRHSMLVWLHRPTCHQHNLLPGVTAVTTLWYRATDRPLHSLYTGCVVRTSPAR